jgi:hypothetical protein
MATCRVVTRRSCTFIFITRKRCHEPRSSLSLASFSYGYLFNECCVSERGAPICRLDTRRQGENQSDDEANEEYYLPRGFTLYHRLVGVLPTCMQRWMQLWLSPLHADHRSDGHGSGYAFAPGSTLRSVHCQTALQFLTGSARTQFVPDRRPPCPSCEHATDF